MKIAQNFGILVIAFALFACQIQKKTQKNKDNSIGLTNAQGDWIKGDDQTQLKLIEKHLRGFDNTMVEVGYRYQELYFGAQDKNWPYAAYQLEKIKWAIELGLERRPKRKTSSEAFLHQVLPIIKKSVDTQDLGQFNENFEMLTVNCNNCHALEKVPHFTVKKPETRKSPIR